MGFVQYLVFVQLPFNLITVQVYFPNAQLQTAKKVKNLNWKRPRDKCQVTDFLKSWFATGAVNAVLGQ